MERNYQHIIQQQSIEIEFENLDDAMGVQNRIAEVFYEKLQPKMEVLFDELFGANYFASIDKLEIDCELLAQKNWEDEWVDITMRKLKAELIQINKKELNPQEQATETFLFFLEHGYLPWNSRIKTIEELEQLFDLDENFISKLKKLIKQSEQVSERLAYQFTENFCEKIIAALAKNKKEEQRNILSGVKKLKHLSIEKRMINAILITTFSDEKKIRAEQSFFQTLYQKANEDVKQELRHSELHPRHSELVSESEPTVTLSEPVVSGVEAVKQHTTYNIQQTTYISNAGLILLHPFLPQLFEQIKLTKDQLWIDEPSQHKAALVLEFLANGAYEFSEFNLPLNKILCDMDLNDVLKTGEPLEDEIKTECENLLTAVIKHWSVLKNTSNDGLRETFLKRNGKLSKVDNGWLLQVEQKAVDILLSHLPWGTGLIKLPWMKEMLCVEWT